MSLPASTIQTLRAQWKGNADAFQAAAEIDRLNLFIEKQKETIEALELTVATMRRRIESLELERGSKNNV